MLQETSTSLITLKDSRNRKAAHRAAFVKEASRRENLSGKAMQDEVLTHAKTHGLKSKSLEEG
jgi:hypothetical protein